MRLTYIRLLVSDFPASFRFYRDVMGFEVAWGEENDGYADFRAGEGTNLALFDRTEMSEAIGTSNLPVSAPGPVQDQVMLIFGVEDVDEVLGRLRRQGVQFVADPQDHPDWGIRTAHFRDPYGNLIEINSPIPHSEWTEELREEASKYTSQ